MLEKLGCGELSVITSDAIALAPLHSPVPTPPPASSSTQPIPQHIHPPATNVTSDEDLDDGVSSRPSLPKLLATACCAALLIGSMLYVADRILTGASGSLLREAIEDIVTPFTGDIVAGYEVSDEYGIRPFHPVTGEPNVPHNGVDLAMPVGTPIYAVGKAGDTVTVECWWDVDGGGWVVDQTAASYPGYTFQSLHMSADGCREGKAKAGEAIAYSGNSGLGTGAHYDFRVKIDGKYVPPATKYLESAVTGNPPQE